MKFSSHFPFTASLIAGLTFGASMFAVSTASAQSCESLFAFDGKNSLTVDVLLNPSWSTKAENDYQKNLKALGVSGPIDADHPALGAGQMLASYSQRHPEIQSGLLDIGFSSRPDRFEFPPRFQDLISNISEKRSQTGATFKIATYNSKKWFRLDEPKPLIARIDAASDMPFLLYADAVANGYTLVWPGRDSLRLLHDLSHVTEYLEHPEVFPALQRYFQRYASKNWQKIPYYKMRAEFFNEVSYILKPAMYDELDALIISSRGDSSTPLETRRQQLNKMIRSDLPTTLDQIQNLVAAFDALFDRHGGGARDAFNIDLALNVATVEAYVNAMKADPMAATHTTQFPKGFTYPTMESLEGIKVQIQYAARKLEDMKNLEDTTDRDDLENFLAHRVAQLETALLKQRELELTQVDIIEDSMLPLGADSKTSRYLRSFMAPKSFLGTLYLE